MRRGIRPVVLVAVVVSLATAGVVPVTTATSASASASASASPADDCGFPVTITDATGRAVTVTERPDRVTTTGPSAAQTMWEIGGRSQVVGLTRFAGYLEGAERRTDVSAEFGASVEAVVGTTPDLVLAPNTSAGNVEALRAAGLTVFHLPASSDLADVRAKTTTIGRLTGNCEGARRANAWMAANVDAVERRTATVEDRPRVLYPLGSGYVAARGTFVDALISVAGGRNVAAANFTGYPQLNDEVVLRSDPEVLVLTRERASLVTRDPYASTTAGRRNATVVLPSRYLSQPAPRSVVYAVHNLTAGLHPTVYDEDSYVPRSAVTDGSDASTPSPSATRTEDATTRSTAPGFGLAVAAVALGLLVALGRVARRE